MRQIKRAVNKVKMFFIIMSERIERMAYWAWALRDSHDWDHVDLLKMEVLKLKRMLAEFESPKSYHSPTCENYKPKMRSIRLAIKLGDILISGDRFAKDLGVDYIFTPSGEDRFLTMTPVHADTRVPLSEPELATYHERLRLMGVREDELSQTFYKILAKYHRYWWD